MAILLHCKHKIGSISLPASRIDGVEVPKRVYTIKANVLRLEGHDAAVLWHDVEDLIANHGSIYRHMTPAEQNAYAEAQQAANTIEE
jgi:hypothetical protein